MKGGKEEKEISLHFIPPPPLFFNKCILAKVEKGRDKVPGDSRRRSRKQPSCTSLPGNSSEEPHLLLQTLALRPFPSCLKPLNASSFAEAAHLRPKCQPLSLHPSSLQRWAKEGTGRTRVTLTRESELPVVWCPWTVWPVCNSVGSKEGHQAGRWFSVPTFP